MITYSKLFQVMTSVSELKKEIRECIGSDCWGCYTQKPWVESFSVKYADDVNTKCVYFDTIELEKTNPIDTEEEKRQSVIRKKLYSDSENELMDEVMSKIDNGEILTVVMWQDQSFGDVSFFKVGDKYVWTRAKKDE